MIFIQRNVFIPNGNQVPVYIRWGPQYMFGMIDHLYIDIFSFLEISPKSWLIMCQHLQRKIFVLPEPVSVTRSQEVSYLSSLLVKAFSM